MKPAPFTYHDPRTIEDATRLLATREGAKLLAGGQSLMPMMNFRYVMPDHVIDLNKVEGLAGFRREGETLRIGAMTRQRDLEYSSDVAQICPVLQEALAFVGHRQTRNRGTIGGSLCHLDPSAELVAIAMLSDAQLEVAKSSGTRRLAISEFCRGYMEPALDPDELLAAIELPCWRPGHGYAYEEFARRHGDFAIVAAGVLIDLDPVGRISRAAIVISGTQPAPVRLRAAEAAMVGALPGEELVEYIANVAKSESAMSDAYVSSQYRQHLSGVLTSRALRRGFEKAMKKDGTHA